MNKKILCINYILLCFLFVACSSPESDGKKAAGKFCDCEQESVKSRQKSYADLIQNFDSYNFQTRVEAREKMEGIAFKIAEEYKNCMQSAERFYNMKSEKYAADYRKNEQFEYAFQGYRKANEVTDATIALLVSQMDNLIMKIIPPKPDLGKLKKDLIGRKIAEGVDGYRKKDWYWEIKSTVELKTVDIKNTSNKGEDYLLDVHLILQGENTDYDANVRIYYVLRQYDDWTIDVIEPQSMNIVQTHKYDNCITTRLWGMLGEHRYEFTNSCDVSLLIGGVFFSETYERWDKFSVIVDANSSTTVGDIYNRIKDCKIHFIERP